MKTNDLINALVADLPESTTRLGKKLFFGLVAGTVVSAAIFLFFIHPRPDFVQATTTIRFPFKFAVTTLLAGSAIGLLARLIRPGAPLGVWRFACLAAPVLLLGAVAAELYVVPGQLWAARLIGVNAKFCLMLQPLLSLAPLTAILFVMREGAPTRPGLAGAAAGLAAGGIGATFYAAHCNDDSPLFVIVWYSIAIGLVTLLGASVGHRALRW